MTADLIGARHPTHTGGDCLCGCQFVDGLPGRIIEHRPDVDLVVAEFDVPSATGGPDRVQSVAYSVAEAVEQASSIVVAHVVPGDPAKGPCVPAETGGHSLPASAGPAAVASAVAHRSQSSPDSCGEHERDGFAGVTPASDAPSPPTEMAGTPRFADRRPGLSALRAEDVRHDYSRGWCETEQDLDAGLAV